MNYSKNFLLVEKIFKYSKQLKMKYQCKWEMTLIRKTIIWNIKEIISS